MIASLFVHRYQKEPTETEITKRSPYDIADETQQISVFLPSYSVIERQLVRILLHRIPTHASNLISYSHASDLIYLRAIHRFPHQRLRQITSTNYSYKIIIPTKKTKMHWIYALTLVRLRKHGGLVENEVFEALKITLRPPSSPMAAGPELVNKIQAYASSSETISSCKRRHEFVSKRNLSPALEGYYNCKQMLRYYRDVSDRTRQVGGYCVKK